MILPPLERQYPMGEVSRMYSMCPFTSLIILSRLRISSVTLSLCWVSRSMILRLRSTNVNDTELNAIIETRIMEIINPKAASRFVSKIESGSLITRCGTGKIFKSMPNFFATV